MPRDTDLSAIRYTDYVSKNDARSDFLPRNRKPTLPVLVASMLLVIALCIAMPALVFDKIALIFWLCIILPVAGWYVILEIVRSRDLVLATEFQNALFTSALGFSNKFCLIVRREGGVVYMDNGFQKLFPDLVKERNISVSNMLKFGKVNALDREKIFSAIERGVYDKIVFDIRGENNSVNKIVMSIEPIIRPSGFLLLRGRDFIEQRLGDHIVEAAPQANPLLSKSSITLFAYVMDRMNTGVYITDPNGNVIYANRLIEQWLAFRESEMMLEKLSLKDIVHQASAGRETISPENFEGEASLRKKDGGLIKAFINQKVINDDDNKPLGCVAMINNMVETDSSIKKTLW